MIEGLPVWIEIVFACVVAVAIYLFHLSNGKPRRLTLLIIGWSILHSVLAFSGFYQVMDTIPPRFALVLLPAFFTLIYAFMPKQVVWAVSERDYSISTFMHAIRIPIEIVLLYLFLHHMIPELMTFEGRNFDIIIGLSAPIVGLLLLKNRISKKALLVWNVLGLLLVCFIYINGILSAELPIQQFGFDQANRAVTFFPFILLPATVVPIVIYTHVIDIIKLNREIKEAQV